MNKFMERIRTERKRVRLNRIQLERRMGISQGYITILEQGKRKPSLKILRKLTTEFQVSADYLVGRTDEYKIYPDKDMKVPHSVKIRDARAGMGYTRTDVSELSGLSLVTIRAIEQDNLDPIYDTVIALCDCLGISIDYILDLEKDVE